MGEELLRRAAWRELKDRRLELPGEGELRRPLLFELGPEEDEAGESDDRGRNAGRAEQQARRRRRRAVTQVAVEQSGDQRHGADPGEDLGGEIGGEGEGIIVGELHEGAEN